MDATPYQKHSETSEGAADLINAASFKAKVLAHIVSCGVDGATDDEIQRKLKMNPSTQRPRRVDLWNEGKVVDSGRRRLTSSNREAVVWVDVVFAPDKVQMKRRLEQILETAGFKSLEEYHKSPCWDAFKIGYFSRHPKVCVITGVSIDIDLHHITYERLGCEKDEDVMPVSHLIHELLHRLVKNHRVPLDQAHLVLKDVMATCVKSS